MDDVCIVGIYSTPVGRFFGKSPKELVREAYLGALQDARLDGSAIGHIWFSNMMLDFWGQPNVKGTIVTLRPGMSYQVSYGRSSHRSSTKTGAKLFIVD